jgi:hypothetical protein
MAETQLPHPGHDKHLCFLANLRFQDTNPDDYKSLVRDGRFYCTQCGRVAASEKNLCKPASL